MTLLEVLLGLSILAMVAVGLNQLADRWVDDTRNAVAAGQLRTFGEAAQSYIKDNYAAVQHVATDTAPAIVDVPTLVAAQKLPPGYQNSNAFGQASCALVLQPTSNRLQAMVLTEGGSSVRDASLGTLAATVGGSGGGIYSSDPATIRGALGGWQLASSAYDNRTNNLGKRCDGTAGNVRVTPGHPVMALWFENGDVSSAFVARDAVPGRPELNAMSTPLVMNSVQTAASVCATTGAIARDNAGALLTCRSGTWQRASGCIGDSTSNLDTLQEDGWCINGAANPNSPAGGDGFFLEVKRVVNRSVYYVAQRVVGTSGASAGRLWVRNQQSAAQGGGWSPWNQIADPGVTAAAGSLATTGSVTAAQGVSAGATVQGGYLYSRGNADAAGAMNAGGNVTGNYLSARAGLRSYSSGDWGVVLGDTAGNLNSNPQSYLGSMHVNDIYVRSVGKWLSQIATGGLNYVSYQSWSPNASSWYYDLGWHKLCTVNGMDGANATGYAVVNGGQDANGWYDWLAINSNNTGMVLYTCFR